MLKHATSKETTVPRVIIIISAIAASLSCGSSFAQQERSFRIPSEVIQTKPEPLPVSTWKTVRVGASNRTAKLPDGESYYAVVSLPNGAGTIEMRMRNSAILAGLKGLLACATFLDSEFRVTHTTHYTAAAPPPVGAFRPGESTLLDLKLEKKPADRYLVIYTDPNVVGKKLRYHLGNRGSTIIVGGSFAYSAPNPTEVDITSEPKGAVRLKFFPADQK